MRFYYFLALASLLSACIAAPIITPTQIPSAPQILTAEENSYAPNPADTQLNRAEIILTSIDLSERVDFTPARVEVYLLGSMPNICSELRLQVKPPDEKFQIYIEAYSVSDPKVKCGNVFQQFEARLLLGNYSAGKYSVLVNHEFVGDFISY